jgi:Tol biopolymer transport system component
VISSSVVRAGVPLWLALCASAAMACTSGKVLRNDATFPLNSGTVFYHTYNTYGDGTGRLFQYDLGTRAKTQIDRPEWGIRDPINAFPHPWAEAITFMGVKNDNWNVFIHKLGSTAEPLNITAALGGRNEDPKFSRDGSKIVIKHEGDIYMADVDSDENNNLVVSPWRAVTNDGFGVEDSMPYFSADGKYIFFIQGASTNMRLYRIKTDGTGKTLWQAPPAGQRDYYPVVRGASNLLFTRSLNSGIDQIVQTSTTRALAPATTVSMNECTANNSDAARSSGSYIIFSSTGYNFGRYGLMVGDISTGAVWRFPITSVNINDGTEKLGASYLP